MGNDAHSRGECGCDPTAVIASARYNRDGQRAIAYRVGTHPQFKGDMLARLSSRDFPALNALTARGDDDFTIAACDALAALADIVAFYQERIANESYLGTALERRSVLHLARLVGYHLSPGVAASTVLAFTLEMAPGAPEFAAQPVKIPIGTRVQSVPDHGQDPQSFETTAAIAGKVTWNGISPQLTETLQITAGLRELFLSGVTPQLQIGDAIGLIADARFTEPHNPRWAVRVVDKIEVDAVRNLTRIAWNEPLDTQWAASDASSVHLFMFRQRAALFGHNAPDPNLLAVPDAMVDVVGGKKEWKQFSVPPQQSYLELDAVYPKLVTGSWAVVAGKAAGAASPLKTMLYRILSNTILSRAGFGLSARVSRLQFEAATEQSLDNLAFRETQVMAESQELQLAERPLLYPLYGNKVVLNGQQSDLAPDQLLAISGKRQRVVVNRAVDLPLAARSLLSLGESFVLSRPPECILDGRMQIVPPEMLRTGSGLQGSVTWHLEASDGSIFSVQLPVGHLELEPPRRLDPVVSEVGELAFSSTDAGDARGRTTLMLKAPLENCFERWSTSINANVVAATHGESVVEIASGSGSGNQQIILKQGPLTYVTSEDGRRSTLEVEVNDILWREVATLQNAGPLDHVYALRHSDNSALTVNFGDGRNGARLPRGDRNVRLRYRKGTGTGGNLRQGQLSILITRPLGVKSVTNPVPSTGGQDPESLDDARRNAPLPTQTLGRAVSVRDYSDYARSFPGIAKASGCWINDFRDRGVHLTIAGPGGASVAPSSEIFANLNVALRRNGDSLLAIFLHSYAPVTFRLGAELTFDERANPEKVLENVRQLVSEVYSFDRRELVQPVALDEVYATVQGVLGVIAVNIVRFHRMDAPSTDVRPVLLARPTRLGGGGAVQPAELLTLDVAALDLRAAP